MDKLKISAIVPVFNGEKFIKEALLSLLKQSYLIHEIIVIDDNSRDNTVKIIKQIMNDYNNIIKLKILNKNIGPSNARNIGIELAEGDWILFLDSDDILLPDLLEAEITTLNFMQKQVENKFVLVYPSYQQIDNDGRPLGVFTSKQVLPKEVLGYEFIRNDLISPSGVLINKAILKQLKGFNTQLRYNEDWDLWLRLASLGGFVYVDKPLVKIRRHGNNASNSLKRMHEAELHILHQYSITIIKEAIYRRNLSFEQNTIDFISVLFRLEKWEDAKECIISIKQSNKCPSNIYFYEGIYHLQKKEINLAQSMFEKLLAIEPQHGSSLNNLGVIHLLSGSKLDAKVYLNKAIELYPGYVDALHNLDLCKRNKIITINDVRFTGRELRKTILRYKQ